MKTPWIFYGIFGCAFICSTFSKHNPYIRCNMHFCEAHGANLVTIDDVHENNFVFSVVYDHLVVLWWIGLTDSIIEGEWKVIPGDQSPSFTNWAPGQPEDYSARDQDCAVVHSSYQYTWHDDSCTAINHPICEKPSGSEIIPIG